MNGWVGGWVGGLGYHCNDKIDGGDDEPPSVLREGVGTEEEDEGEEEGEVESFVEGLCVVGGWIEGNELCWFLLLGTTRRRKVGGWGLGPTWVRWEEETSKVARV